MRGTEADYQNSYAGTSSYAFCYNNPLKSTVARLCHVPAAMLPPELIAAILNNDCEPSERAVARIRSIPEAALLTALQRICAESIFDESCVNLHRADQAPQEVTQKSSIENLVS